jgi:hypothetical protein
MIAKGCAIYHQPDTRLREGIRFETIADFTRFRVAAQGRTHSELCVDSVCDVRTLLVVGV